MTVTERRQEIMTILVARRQETAANLSAEFGVSERTIRSDILSLSLDYPIETVQGRYGGGIRLAAWYRPSKKVLTGEQIAAVKKAAAYLEGADRQALLSILSQFTVP